MTAIVYRNAGAWGPGKGALLTSLEADTNFYNLDQAKADRINSGKTTAVQSPNLLYNGSGEQGDTGWTTANFAAGSDLVAAGGTRFSNGAAIVAGATVFDEGYKIAVGAGVSLCISGELFTGPATAGSASFIVTAYDAANASLGVVCQTAGLAFGNNYAYQYATGVTPANTASVTVKKTATGNPLAPIGGFQFRRIKLEQGVSPSTYSQESTTKWLYDNTLKSANNLSDVANPATALSTLGGLAKVNNLSDIASASTSLTNLGGLAKANNLSDVANVATARSNLKVGFTLLATHDVTNVSSIAFTDADFGGYDAVILECYGLTTTSNNQSIDLRVAPNTDGSGGGYNTYIATIIYAYMSSGAPVSAGGGGRNESGVPIMYSPTGSAPLANASATITVSNLKQRYTSGIWCQGTSLSTDSALSTLAATVSGGITQNITVKNLSLNIVTGTFSGTFSLFGINR